ncbi:NVEALA domain-containing protein [Parabacteroides chinchillae]
MHNNIFPNNHINKIVIIKKKIVGLVAVSAITIAGWYFIQNSEVKLSDLTLDNIEALAGGESGSEYHSAFKYNPILDRNICNGPGNAC